MDGSDHPRGGKPSVSQLLQGLQKGLEILLFLARGPITPVAAGGSHHLLRKRREPPIVIPEVKPPVLSPLVRRHKDGGDVLLRARLPQLETGPQIPVGVNPQKAFTNRREDGRLCDGVGVEIVQLHPVVMQERPHETACWHSEPSLMEGDETQHIPRWRGRGSPARMDHPLRLRVTREGTEQAIGDKGLQVIHRDGGERPRVARRNDGYPVCHHQAKRVAAERARCVVFFLWLFPWVVETKAGGEQRSKEQPPVPLSDI
jgi:hypothetical protein